MGSSIWPLLLVVGSNVIYHLSAKCSSREAHPFASLTVVYAIAAVASLVLYGLCNKGFGGLGQNFRALNWANYLLGLAIIGLEGGYIWLYRAGWSASVGPICSYVLLAICLLFVGFFFFKEHISYQQVLGTLLCIAGIVLIAYKKG